LKSNAIKTGIKTYLLSNLLDRLNAGAIQVVAVLPSLDKHVVLNVVLHLFAGNEVVVSAVHLVLARRTCGIYASERLT